ncbi:hypothetical protein D018_3525A, partial [Vibrio parahaemolyticus VP2007-007]
MSPSEPASCDFLIT